MAEVRKRTRMVDFHLIADHSYMQITFVCKSVQFHVQTMYGNPFSCVCKSFTLYMQITYVYKSLQLHMQITSAACVNHLRMQITQ